MFIRLTNRTTEGVERPVLLNTAKASYFMAVPPAYNGAAKTIITMPNENERDLWVTETVSEIEELLLKASGYT